MINDHAANMWSSRVASKAMDVLPRVYSAESVKIYLKRIRLAQQTGLTNFDDVFDPAISRLIKSHADAIGCPRETILCSVLVAVAGCMGPKTDVEIDSDWLEKPILWMLVAGRRGDCKTPALNRVKSAVTGLEREIQAVHVARSVISKQNKRQCPLFLVDQNNFEQVSDYVKMSLDQNLIGMFDNFGTFLRHCSLDSVFFDPNTLLSMYDSTLESGLRCNFLGMIEAIDAAALMEKFDADGLSDRVLVICPKVPGCKQTKIGGSPFSVPTLQNVFSAVRNYHQEQNVTYTFRADGHAAFQRCLAELDLWQSGFVCDERRRGVLAKAPGQLARLTAVLCGLKTGLEICTPGSKSHQHPSSAMTADTVNSARQILMYLINQKMSFLPNDESLTEDTAWDDMAETIRVEMNSPSSLDVPRVIHKEVQETVYLPHSARGNPGLNHGKVKARDSPCPQPQPYHSSVLSTGRRRGSSDERTHHPNLRNPASEVSEDPQYSRHESFPRSSKTPPVVMLADSDLEALVNPLSEDDQSSLQFQHMQRKRGADDTGQNAGCVKIVRKRQAGRLVNQDVMVYSVDDSTNGEEVGADVSRDDVDDFSLSRIDGREAVAGTSHGSNSWKLTVPEGSHDSECSYMRENIYPKFDIGPSSFRSFRTSVNMFQLTDDQLITQCSQKIKKLLLLPGMIASSASICQKRLFPPVPKELRVEHPRTTHPVWGALAFLKRLVHMGLGELVHPLYRMQAIHFRKIRLEYMKPDARALLPQIDLTEEEYEQSYPKFDDSHLTTFVLIEDIERAVRQRLKADGQTIRRN